MVAIIYTYSLFFLLFSMFINGIQAAVFGGKRNKRAMYIAYAYFEIVIFFQFSLRWI